MTLVLETAPIRTSVRARLARMERPLLAAGLALVALHLLDRTFSGSHTSLLSVLLIVAAPPAWLAAQPRVIRPTRVALGLVIGLFSAGFGIASHGLHAVNSGLDRYDLTGLGLIAGGLLLVAAGAVAVAAPRGALRDPGGGSHVRSRRPAGRVRDARDGVPGGRALDSEA